MTKAERTQWLGQVRDMSTVELVALLERLASTRQILEEQERDLRRELEARRNTLAHPLQRVQRIAKKKR